MKRAQFLREVRAINRTFFLACLTTVLCSAALSALWRLFLVTWHFVATFP